MNTLAPPAAERALPTRGPRRLDLPGFRLDPGSIDCYLTLVEHTLDTGSHCTVLYHNLHSLYLFCRSQQLRVDYRDATVMLDGMPLVALARLHGHRLARRDRVTWVDFLPALLDLAVHRSLRVRHIGQSHAIQQAAIRRLRERHPGLDLAGHHGYFDTDPASNDSVRVLAWIKAEAPSILLVGLGTPLQEHWIASMRDRMDVPVVFACGAAFEYESGAVAAPPRWLGPLGLEWTARLAGDPRRFAYRYLVEPLLLARLLRRRAREARDEHVDASSSSASLSGTASVERHRESD